MSRVLTFRFLPAAAFVVVNACRSVSGAVSDDHRSAQVSPRSLISAQEIQRSNSSNALELVQKLRPGLLRGIRTPGTRVQHVIYVDGARYGGVETLETIAARDIVEIHILTGPEATWRFGPGHSGGALVVTTKGRVVPTAGVP